VSANKLEAIRALNTRIASVEEEIRQAVAEVDMLEHIDDDAQRDALVSEGAEDRQVARMTARDVRRAERYVERLRADRSKLAMKRDRLIEKLARS
jgi:hypothetical protein